MVREDPRRLLQTVLAMLPAVLITLALSLAGLYVVRRYVPQDYLRASNDAAGNYLQTLGTIYAVLLAWVVAAVWSQFNDARAQVEREANELMDLFRTVKGFPEAQREQIHDLARAYAEEVMESEWDAMRRNDNGEMERVGHILDKIWHVLHTYEPGDDGKCALYGEALARFNDLSDARANRISSSRLRVPLGLKILIRMGAILTVASLYLFAIDRFLVHAVMTAALSASIAMILYLINDLDDCFNGDWQVSRGPFVRVLTYMRRYTRKAAP